MKNVLITGACGGIGKAVAYAFAKEKYNVALHSFSQYENALEFAKELSDIFGITAFAVKADISKENEVLKMFEELDENFGKIDVLVNNAGVSSVMMLCDTDENEWNRVMDINLKGAFLCTKEAIKNMVHNKWGRVINISSVWGNVGASLEVVYSASKAGLVGFTKALARELAPSNVTVNAVSPGLIDTKMNSHLSKEEIDDLCNEIPAGRMGKPEEVASIVLYLASDDASYITSQNIAVDGGWQ